MTDLPYSPIFTEEFGRLTHQLAERVSTVLARIYIIDLSRVTPNEKANLLELIRESERLYDVVVQLQKMIGQR